MLASFDPFGDVPPLPVEPAGRKSLRAAPLGVDRRDEGSFAHVDVPDIDLHGVELTVEGDVSNAGAERSWGEARSAGVVARGRARGRVERGVHLGPSLDRQHLEACRKSCRRGVPTVRVPALETPRRHRIPVRVAEASTEAGAAPLGPAPTGA